MADASRIKHMKINSLRSKLFNESVSPILAQRVHQIRQSNAKMPAQVYMSIYECGNDGFIARGWVVTKKRTDTDYTLSDVL